MVTGDFGKNLRLLCGYEASISEVCRRTGINRQQFHRYLGGEALPSLRVMRRLCDHFGVEESEILQEHGCFRELVALRKPRSYLLDPLGEHILALSRINPHSTRDLREYLGYYFSYLCPAEFPGKVMRSLVLLSNRGGFVYSRTFESYKAEKMRKRKFLNYTGVVFHSGDKIFVYERERLVGRMIWTTVLDPAQSDQFSALTGLTLGATSGVPRQTASYRVVWQSLGTGIRLRSALADCGLFSIDSDAIPRDMVERITDAAGAGVGGIVAVPWEGRPR